MAQTILIIDDDIDTLKLVGIMLERKGFKILASTTGKKGLQLATDELPDFNSTGYHDPGSQRI